MAQYLDAATATWEEAKAFLTRMPAAILPLGATEQHGPHLPQNTDTILAGEICRGVAERTVGYLLPPIPITYSWVWRDFPGSAWIGTETFIRVIKDVVHSMERGGVRAMLIVTGHGANQAPLKYAVRELADESKIAMMHGAPFGIGDIAKQTESPLWLSPYELHAEELETSLMLAVRPDLVRMDKVVADYPPIPDDYGHTVTSMGNLARSGVFGDATKATREKGVRWMTEIVDNIASLWLDFLRRQEILSK